MRINEVQTVMQHFAFYSDAIKDLTPRKKKNYINKELKLCKDYDNDIKAAFSKEYGNRWYHGEQVNIYDIKDNDNTIEALISILQMTNEMFFNAKTK